MMTNDNRYTAISVAKECRLLQDRFYLGDLNESQELQWTFMEKRNSTLVQTNEETKSSRGQQDSLTENADEDFTSVRAESKSPWKERNCSLILTARALDFFTGRASNVDESTAAAVLRKTAVVAEVSGRRKLQFVEALKRYGDFVGVYANSASECLALQEAGTGVALAETEASIAALFTPKAQDLNCILHILKEGRAALVNSYQCFKYVALFSMIQFISVNILYRVKVDLADVQYTYSDFLLAMLLFLTINLNGPASKLSKKRPPTSFICLRHIISIIGHVLIQAFFQVLPSNP
eukprot:TRINITY_DN4770_c0_g1_i10.p1 TRINITY_DN4770_c0_g1~~TRINITY_DN4770_c0_g1_i10.p1  ORF type:complete len:294 (-),score=69.77 TRINITY_DN4770_c0_g1_i10:613-1494(-)